MDSTMGPGIDVGSTAMNEIAKTYPILAILLLVFLAVIWVLYKALMKKGVEYNTLLQTSKEEVKELNTLLLNVREADKEMLVNLKNLIAQFVEVEKMQSKTRENVILKVDDSIEKINALGVKIDLLLTDFFKRT